MSDYIQMGLASLVIGMFFGAFIYVITKSMRLCCLVAVMFCVSGMATHYFYLRNCDRGLMAFCESK